MATNTDDNEPDDPPFVLRLREPQVRYPRGQDANHLHIWSLPGTVGQDDGGGSYSIATCVNCPAVRVERTGGKAKA